MLRISRVLAGACLLACIGSVTGAQSSETLEDPSRRTTGLVGDTTVLDANTSADRPMMMPMPVGVRRSAGDHPLYASQDRRGWNSHRGSSCDPSKFKAAETRRTTGSLLALGGLLVAGIGTYKLARYNGEGSYVPPAVLAGSGLLVVVIGQTMMKSTVSPQDFDKAVQTVRTGETKLIDITGCMGTPRSRTSNGDVQTATYMSKDVRTIRSVVFTAKAGVVSDVQKAEVQRDR